MVVATEVVLDGKVLYLCTFCLTTTCCCSSSAATAISSGQKPFYLTIIEKCKDSAK
jgi:hypothetical protein